MSPSAPPPLASTSAVWTCPYCPLLCDRFQLSPQADGGLGLLGSHCSVAQQGLADQAPLRSGAAEARVDGVAVTQNQAVAEAARRLAASRQPLLGGLGTDVAGARALFRLARATGAISDAAGGAALMQTVRVLQDRGGFTTTLAEVRERADVIVFVGAWAPERLPELLPRPLAGRADAPPALVALSSVSAPGSVPGPDGRAIPVATVAGQGDLFATLQQLTALVAGKAVREPDPGLMALAAQLQAAHYAVLVWEPAQLGAQAALLIERLQQLIGHLNQRTRAAGFPLGGGDGAATVNQVFTWLGGLPLRSRHGPLGNEHEPLRFDAQRLIADRAVDALLWVSSFRAAPVPVLAGPRIVLGLPALAAHLGDEANTVFIPVSTPGLHTSGHLCRADGVVMLPLHAAVSSALPSVAEVAGRLADALGTQAFPERMASGVAARAETTNSRVAALSIRCTGCPARWLTWSSATATSWPWPPASRWTRPSIAAAVW